MPTKEQIECQYPKPILLNTGNANLPYRWHPAIIPISVFRVGQLFILSVPGEFTTMAGRRLRGAIRALLIKHDIVKDPVVTIAGLANSYTHYVTTIEEYAGQRYEAASTLYGPHTLSAYIQEFERITKNLLDGTPSATDKAPDDLSSKQLSLLTPVELDTVGIGRKVSFSFFPWNLCNYRSLHCSQFFIISVRICCHRCTGSVYTRSRFRQSVVSFRESSQQPKNRGHVPHCRSFGG